MKVRAKVQTFGFGGPTEVTSGGNALKFYSSVRLNVRRYGLVKKGEETIGSQVLVKIVKNKHAPPFKTAQFELEFGKGICHASEIIDLGYKHKFISKSGAFYYLNDRTFHGKEALKKYLAENEETREELALKLREKLIQNKNDSESEVADEDVHEEILTSDTTDEDLVATAGA